MPTSKKPICNKFAPMSIAERELLESWYIDQDYSAEEIAIVFKVSERLIYMRLKEHGISKPNPNGKLNKYKSPHYCGSCGQVIWRPKKGKK